jgi:hypothetical protein
MHFANIIIVPRSPDGLDGSVASAMDRRIETGDCDWWQIGGRWTGLFDGFEPSTDPSNTEKCDLCNGTGLRNDALGLEARRKDPAYTCNGCDGKRTRLKWPTAWARYEGDVIAIEKLTDEHVRKVYSVVALEEAYESEHYVPNGDPRKLGSFAKHVMPTARLLRERYPNHLCVVVDCHN